MRRPILLTLVALGVLVSLIGSTGLFAALTDTARTGTNSVDSAALAVSADIQLATGDVNTDGGVGCGTFAENLLTGFFTVNDIQADAVGVERYFCIRNVGSQSVSLSALADELTDLDSECTGDEADYDALTCGGDLAGELATILTVGYSPVDCETTGGISFSPLTLASNVTTARDLGDLAPGATGCYWVIVYHPDAAFLGAEAVQKAQSDTVTWRFKFIAEA